MVLFSIVFLIIALYIYYTKLTDHRKSSSSLSKGIWILLGAAFLVRIILAATNYGHPTDMGCFLGWSTRVFDVGFGEFYSSDPNIFSDYPPGYMYILYILGGIRSMFGMNAGGTATIVLTKLPAILCDLGIGYLFYQMAKKRLSMEKSQLLTALWLFNPVVLLNASIWGQVDSVFTLFVFLMVYEVSEEKLPAAYVAFALGILVKPQTLIFAPILICAIIRQVFLENFTWKRMWTELLSGFAAIAGMFLLALPFGVGKVISQYVETMGSYKFASVNAYNIWALFNKNWASQDNRVMMLSCNTWGTIFIVLTVLIVSVLCIKCSKKGKSCYFFCAAFMVSGMFTMSVRMHERYLFPAIILLLAAYLYSENRLIFFTFVGVSVFHFLNVGDVYYHFDANNYNAKNPVIFIVSAIGVIVFAGMCMVAWRCYYKGKMENAVPKKLTKQIQNALQESRIFHIQKSEKLAKLVKYDIIAMLVISVVYGCVAFYNLGDQKAPESFYNMKGVNESVILDFGKEQTIKEINYYLGYYETREFQFQMSVDGQNWDQATNHTMDSVFKWGRYSGELKGRYLCLISLTDKACIGELQFKNDKGEVITPVNAGDFKGLMDEPELVPKESSKENSTYFDEIYHARTAYEYIHHLYCYENTHPPLGKIFIALGILIFGMNPFGWRFMGTLFGVLMLPLIYTFAKKLFRESWLATIVTLLFAFDFMHFVQTRIATIDVFVTLFVIAMYYFMYCYTRLSFYDTPLKKTWIPLGLCGISMGLGVACKMTGVYAGCGLAIIFFAHLYRRYKEFVYAKKRPDYSTDGIAHAEIIAKFKPYTWKTIGFCCIFFIVIPAIIYLLSYLPFRDYEDSAWLVGAIKNQKTMFDYHSKLKAEHYFSTWWYEWPIILKPIWYYSRTITDTVKQGISAFGNPAVWWCGIPAFFYMVYLWFVQKNHKAGFLCIGYLAQYMPWFFVTRITFIYHYFPSVPFVVLMIVYSIYKLTDGKPKRRKYAYIYVAVAIGLFIMFYPVLSGQSVHVDYVTRFLKWFKSWVLI